MNVQVCRIYIITTVQHCRSTHWCTHGRQKPQKQRTAPSWNFTSNCDAVPPRLHRERCGGLGEPNASRWAHGTLGFGSSIAFSANQLGFAPSAHDLPLSALDRRLPASPELMTLLPSALQRLLALLRSPAFVRCTGLLPARPSQFKRAPLTTWELSFEIRDVAQVLHRFMNGHWSHAFQLNLVHATLRALPPFSGDTITAPQLNLGTFVPWCLEEQSGPKTFPPLSLPSSEGTFCLALRGCSHPLT